MCETADTQVPPAAEEGVCIGSFCATDHSTWKQQLKGRKMDLALVSGSQGRKYMAQIRSGDRREFTHIIVNRKQVGEKSEAGKTFQGLFLVICFPHQGP